MTRTARPVGVPPVGVWPSGLPLAGLLGGAPLVGGLLAGALLVGLTGCTTPAPTPVAPTRPNVLLVSMDTVRYDHTSLGGARDTTPNLARLAARGVAYDRCFTVGNESLYSHAAILTGRYPSEVAIPDYKSFMVPSGTTTLAGALGANGYRTAAFTGGGHILAVFGFDQGFDSFKSAGGDGNFGTFYDSVPPAIDWIDQANKEPSKPWFAFVHGYDAHSPYIEPGPFVHYFGTTGKSDRIEAIATDALSTEQLRGNLWFPDRATADFVHAAGKTILGTDFYSLPATRQRGERVVELADSEIAHLRDHYDTGIAYGDTWLGLLLSHVDLDHTLVIVLSDHGEDLLSHGFMNHRAGLWDSTTHVPLVVSGPGFTGGERRSALVDLRSVVPTVLEAVGVTPLADATGTALQSLPDPPAVFVEGVMDMVSVRTAAARLVMRHALLPKEGSIEALAARPLDDGDSSLYDLATDPGETRDLLLPVNGAPPSTDTLARAGALRDLAVAWRRGLHASTQSGAPVPDSVRDQLRKNGYWTPEEGASTAQPRP